MKRANLILLSIDRRCHNFIIYYYYTKVYLLIPVPGIWTYCTCTLSYLFFIFFNLFVKKLIIIIFVSCCCVFCCVCFFVSLLFYSSLSLYYYILLYYSFLNYYLYIFFHKFSKGKVNLLRKISNNSNDFVQNKICFRGAYPCIIFDGSTKCTNALSEINTIT